jgi:hypothetical protein
LLINTSKIVREDETWPTHMSFETRDEEDMCYFISELHNFFFFSSHRTRHSNLNYQSYVTCDRLSVQTNSNTLPFFSKIECGVPKYQRALWA